MRQICNISNVCGFIVVLGTFSFCIYQILWAKDLFPYTSLLFFSLIGLGQIVGVGFSRKSSLYLYAPISFMNIINLGLFSWEFFTPSVLEELWNINFSITISIVFLSLISITQKLQIWIRRTVQTLLVLNLFIILYFLLINSYDKHLNEIILISTMINFAIVFLTISFKYLMLKKLNTDKFQSQINEEANNSTV